MTSRGVSAAQYAILCGMAFGLFGGVHTGVMVGLAVVAMALVIAVGRCRSDRSSRGVWGALLLAISWSAVVLVPVGPQLREWLSPGYAALVESGLAEAGAVTHSLALVPSSAGLGLFVMASFVLLSLSLAQSLDGEESQLVLLRYLVMIVTGVMGLGLIQRVIGAPSIYWFSGFGEAGDLLGTFVNPNHAGYAAAVALTLSPLFWRKERPASAIPAVILVLALLASNSRGALLAAGVGAMMWILLSARLPRWSLFALFSVPVAIVVLVGPYDFGVMLTRWFDPAFGHRGYEAADISTGRIDFFQGAVDLLWHAPLFGAGFGGFAEAFEVVKPLGRNSHVTHAHSEPLQMLVEQGLVAGSLVVVAMTGIVHRLITTRGSRSSSLHSALSAACSVVVVGVCVDFPLRSVANGLLSLGVLAVVMAPVGQSAHSRRQRIDPVIIWAVFLAFIGFFVGVHFRLGTSQEPRQVLATEPLNDQAWFSLAQQSFSQVGPDEIPESTLYQGVHYLQRLTDQNRANPWAWLNLARAYDRLGHGLLAADAWLRFLSIDIQVEREPYLIEALDLGKREGFSPFMLIPERADIQCQAASLLARGGDWVLAEPLFIAGSEQTVRCQTSYGRWLQQRGDAQAALDVLPADKLNCLSEKVRGRAYLSLGMNDRARRAYGAALSLCPVDDQGLKREMSRLEQ